MNWILAAVFAAIFFTLTAVLSKELMDHIDSLEFTALYSLVAFIFYTPIFLYYNSIYSFDFTTFLILLIILSGIGNILGMLAYNYGLKHTSLSIAMPLNRTQPVFVAIIGFLLLNEVMNLQKILGIITVTAGSYIVLLEDPHNPLDPITNLVHDYGAQLAVVSAIIFSFTAVIDRYVNTQMQPELYTYLILGIMTAALNTYLTLKKDKNYTKHVKTELTQYTKLYTLTGILTATAYLTMYTAYSQAEASQVIPVMQLQVPLTVIAGKEIFDETHIIEKIIGSILLILGIILVV